MGDAIAIAIDPAFLVFMGCDRLHIPREATPIDPVKVILEMGVKSLILMSVGSFRRWRNCSLRAAVVGSATMASSGCDSRQRDSKVCVY